MYTRRKVQAWIILCILVCLLVLMIYPAYLLYQRIHFDESALSPAGKIVKAYADKHDIAFGKYPDDLIALLDRNPETETFVLEYPLKKDADIRIDLSDYKGSTSVPLFLQWDQRWGYIEYGSGVAGLTACGPVCLSMAAWYLTEDDAFAPDKMIEFATNNGYYSPGNGSSWTLISEGGVKLGFDVTEIPLVESRIIKNLEVDNPIICAMGPGDFTTTGHYIVMTGYENGMIRINDPNSIANSEKLWKYEDIEGQIRNLWVIRK